MIECWPTGLTPILLVAQKLALKPDKASDVSVICPRSSEQTSFESLPGVQPNARPAYGARLYFVDIDDDGLAKCDIRKKSVNVRTGKFSCAAFCPFQQ